MSFEETFSRRLVALLVGLSAAAALVAGRLVQIQILGAAEYRVRARSQHEGTVKLEGRRGAITDRNGRELAVSIETDSAFIHPWQLRDPEGTSRRLARALSIDGAALAARIRQGEPFVWVKRKISPAERRRIEDLGLEDPVHFTRESRRFYPKGSLASHLIGFVGTDGVGLEGLEKDFDPEIRGEGESFVVLRDAKGGALLQQVRQAGRPGASLELTIDESIQHAAETELEAAMKRTGARKGTIIVADPRTGEILALANRPTFDPHAFGAVPAAWRKNVGIGDRYEPGSTFKIITAAAGLEEGRVRPSEWFDCGHGSILVGSQRVRDHKSFGSLSFTDVIAKSSNVGIIRLGLRIGAPTLHEYVLRFGFGRSTGLGLSGEAEGIVNRLSRWSSLSVASVSMGQEVLVTPVQMLNAFCTIARDGRHRSPRVVRAVIGPDGERREIPSTDSERVVSPATARELTGMMEQVVLSGSGKRAAIPGYRVAGKTGTAQKIGPDGRYSHTLFTASFAGYAPSRSPRVAAIVVLDEPRGLYTGGEAAAPSFARVAGAALEILRIRPDTDHLPPAPEFLPTGPLPAGNPLLAFDPSRGRPAGETAPASKKPPVEWPPRPATAARTVPAAPAGAAVSTDSIPELFGLSLREAVNRLSDRGYLVFSTGTGFVTAQDPPAGTPAARGTFCRLRLSLDPPESLEERADGAPPGAAPAEPEGGAPRTAARLAASR